MRSEYNVGRVEQTRKVDRKLVARWRVGRTVGRTIYAQRGPEASLEDDLIGVMDTPDLAEEVVRSHNRTLQRP